MTMKRIVLYIFITILTIQVVCGQTRFRTSELERLATTLSLDVTTLPEGYSHPVANGLSLTVHVSRQIVDHIGLQVFADELRQEDHSPIFDFLERYFLQLKFPPVVKSASHMLRDDGFRFVSGSIADIDKLLVTDAFSYQYDNHHYTATWNRAGQNLLTVSFPVEYELISGENKIEAEENLMADILQSEVKHSSDNKEQDDNYISNDFTNRLYFQRGQLVCNTQHPVETIANMMLSTNAKGDYKLKLTQISYGFQKKVFQVPLHQWIAFCKNNGCELFFGVESLGTDGCVSAVILAVNRAENYNHVLTVSIPTSLIDQRQGTIDARLYPYVPMHNVKSMFANYRKSNPKTFVSR